jgi:DNA-binding ferritin-like protein
MIERMAQGITNLPISGTVEGFIAALIAGATAYVWYRFKQIENKVESSVTRYEVKEMIEDRVKYIEHVIKDSNDDIKRIDSKLDKVLTALLRSRQGE